MFTATDNTRRRPANYIAVAVLCAALAPVASGARIPPDDPVLEPVSLYLNVEKDNGLITGLGENNFHAYLDGAPIRFRLAQPETPASIALLAEFSRGSGYYLEDIDRAVRSLMKHGLEGNYYALATFAQTLSINCDFTQRPAELVNTWSSLPTPFSNEINTYDAIYEMLDKLGQLSGRRILIVIGSGMDTFSEHTMEDVKKKAESVNVVIFAIGAGSAFRGAYETYLNTSSRMTMLQSRAFLQSIASASGGFSWFPAQVNGFPDAMLGAMQSIATQYRLAYERPLRVSGKFHKIKVEAFRIVNDKREDFTVLVRSGWRE